MTDWRSSDDPSAGGYQGPPPGGQYGQPTGGPYDQPNDQPTYPTVPQQYPPSQPYGYPQQGYPPQGYPPPGYGGYPAPGYPPGYGSPYSPQPPGDRRPGTVTAAAVLGYIAGGLLILAAIMVFFISSTIRDLYNNFDQNGDSHTGEFVLAGIANLIAAGLLIAGGVSMTGRKTSGRRLYLIGSGIVVVATIYWLARWATKGNGAEQLIIYGLLFAALVIIGTALACTGDSNKWLARR